MKQGRERKGLPLEPFEHWVNLSKTRKRLIVFNGEEVLDLTDFAKMHPGGEKALTCYNLHDIENIVFRVYPHPASTASIMQRYVCGRLRGPRK
jgi:cytochrome b involved in lipid metabolism